MRVLVTGGAGFIGSHVVDDLLGRGDEVTVVDDLSTGNVQNLSSALARGWSSDRLHRLDVATPSAVECVAAVRPDVLVLLAAQASVAVSMRDPVSDTRSNVLGLVTMLDAARSSGVGKIVFAASGGTIYGEPEPGALPVVEDDPRHPVSFYGLSKSVAVDYLRLYRRHFGMDFAALALGNVYGRRQAADGEAGVIAIFAERLRAGRPCIINGDGCSTRDYVHVSDVSAAIVAATRRGAGLINIGTGIETDVNEIHSLLAERLRPGARAEHVPACPGEVRRLALDVRRARDELAWRPTVTLADGVADLVAGFRRC